METKDSTNGPLAGLAARNPDADIPPLPSVFDLMKWKLNLRVETNALEWVKPVAQLAFGL